MYVQVMQEKCDRRCGLGSDTWKLPGSSGEACGAFPGNREV